MISLEEAREFVLSVASRREPTIVPVAEALGLVLASDIVSGVSIPPFANTAMDGFAVRASDVVDAPVSLHIAGTIAAGQAPSHVLQPGEAMRIMTGAVVPEGADAIVMVELTSVDDDKADTVLVSAPVPVGNHIRGIGDDVTPGDLLFSAGDVLGAGHLGVLCSLGLTEVSVFRRLRIGVISTGDELVDDGSPLGAGQIRDSNRRTVLSLVTSAGADAVDLGLVRDDHRSRHARRSGFVRCGHDNRWRINGRLRLRKIRAEAPRRYALDADRD
ncbi:MAG: molybdopterin molybdotransferase MoeA [Actinobacteria bacterium]|nr:molybdopterin molybdotransferase MoeA [Actinomycetota bacterium]